MLEYLIPEGTDTAEARRLLTQKGEADLRAQGASLFDTLKHINDECKVTNEKGEEVGFDYQASEKLSGSDSDRNAQLMRMTAERKAIRQELAERADRSAVRDEIASVLPSEGNAYGDGGPIALPGATGVNLPTYMQLEVQMESLVGNHVQALLDESGSGAGFDSAKGARPFLENHKTFSVPGLTLDAILGSEFGHPRSQMTQGTGGTGYKPFSYRDLREALMTSQINSYTGMLERRSTDGQLKVNYLQETAQTFAASNVAEGGEGGESNFTVAEATVDLKKISTYMQFSAEELRSRNDFVGFLTTRIVRAVANRLEQQLIKGTNLNNQLDGLETEYPATTGAQGNTLTAGAIGLDRIEQDISEIENVAGQQVTSILMEKGGITAMRTWHVDPGATPNDLRYIIGDPRARGPLVLWDVPVVRVPSLTADVVFTMDSMPVVVYDRGEAMTVRFSDSHGDNFTKDVWAAVSSVWAQVAYTRATPATPALTSAAYIRRLSGFANVKS